MSGSGSDKRDAERIEILGDLQGEVMVFSPMAIREISRTGAQVETAFPLQLDSLHDFRLTLGSPALDAGTPANAPASDIVGVGRPQGPGIDIGAYELVR